MAEHLTFDKAARYFASNLSYRMTNPSIKEFVDNVSDVFNISGTDDEKCQEIMSRFVEALKGNQKEYTYIAGDIRLDVNVDDITRVLVSEYGPNADKLDQAINYSQDAWGGYLLDKQKFEFILEQIHDGMSYKDNLALYKDALKQKMPDVTITSEGYHEASDAADDLFDFKETKGLEL